MSRVHLHVPQEPKRPNSVVPQEVLDFAASASSNPNALPAFCLCCYLVTWVLFLPLLFNMCLCSARCPLLWRRDTSPPPPPQI
mmetsp:Transcript_89134/g.237915  ORF Transcript_89134/g.237915 Transcript_89134/m.237915 type:complete len:83 (+) Transcript_89134:378-626(+)